MTRRVVTWVLPYELPIPTPRKETLLRIGILGSGLMGAKLGTIWLRAGHEVVFSYSRSEAKLKKLGPELAYRFDWFGK